MWEIALIPHSNFGLNHILSNTVKFLLQSSETETMAGYPACPRIRLQFWLEGGSEPLSRFVCVQV